jgi:hypothetical protein
MANSSLFNINLTLPNLNKLLQRCPAAYTAYTASAAPVQKPSNRQSNPIKVLNTLPPLRQVAPATWRKVS